MIAITAVWPPGVGPYGRCAPDTPEAGGESDITYAFVYSATVAITLGVALAIGMQSFTAGAVWAANGAFFIIGPNRQQSMVHALERVAGVILGLAGGILAVELTTDDTALVLIWAVLGTIAVATLTAGYFIMVAAYTAGMTMTWAVQGADITTLNTTDRLLAESLAFLLAIAAVALLAWWQSSRVEIHTASME